MVKGIMALVGSGELSGTMVETHKKLLSRISNRDKALFLDTPAGFQENVDLIALRAVDYFENKVRHPMEIASFKSAKTAFSPDGEQVYQLLGEAGYVLIGPGSPSYTVRQLKETPVPNLLSAMVTRGGCLVTASAAALTVGSHTLPVYEIYKVGEDLHWIEGLNLLGLLGLDLVVIPHWNNAEGGNHDTRFCYMGEKRFKALEKELPPHLPILGIDEHTACLLDFATGKATVAGIGQVTIRRNGKELYYEKGNSFPFEQLFMESGPETAESPGNISSQNMDSEAAGPEEPEPAFWDQMHRIEKAFHQALDNRDSLAMATLLLEADRVLWQAQLDLENPEFVSQGRELYRELIVLAGTGMSQPPADMPDEFKNLVRELIRLREQYRRDKRWDEADQIRLLLQKEGVVLEDRPEGPHWRLKR